MRKLAFLSFSCHQLSLVCCPAGIIFAISINGGFRSLGEQMKHTIRYIILIGLILASAGCAQRKNNNGKIGQGRSSRSNGSFSSPYGASAQAQGNVTPADAGSIAAFTSNLANGDGSPVVPCTIRQVKMAVQVNASVNSNGNGGYQEVSNNGAQFHLDIIDSCVGQPDPTNNNQPYTDIEVDIDANSDGFEAGGNISGTAVNLFFQDDFGIITLNGNVQGGMFSGIITFQNYWAWDNNGNEVSGQSGNIGSFNINAASVLIPSM
jgi:hypothetical protein